MPDNSDDKIKRFFGELIDATPPLAPLNIREAETTRALIPVQRIARSRRTWIAAVIAAAAVITILVSGLPSTPTQIDDSVLGLRVSAASTVPTVKHGIGITFIVSHTLPGYRPVISSRATNASAPNQSAQYVTYSPNKGTNPVPELTVQLEPIPAYQVQKAPPRKDATPGPKVHGVMSYFSSQMSQRPHAYLEPCAVFNTNHNPKNQLHSEQLMWNVPSGIAGIDYQYEVSYLGAQSVSESQLIAIARGVTLASKSWNCWALRGGLLRQVNSAGACTIGEVDNPPFVTHLSGATKIAQGTLFGTPWIFEAATMECPATPNALARHATEYELVGANGLGCLGTNLNISPNAAGIKVDNLSNGQRLACGFVPIGITSVTAYAKTGPGVTERIFAKHLGNKGFFVLSLGKIGKACYYVCHGSVTFKFFNGSKLVASEFMQPGAVDSSGVGFTIGRSG